MFFNTEQNQVPCDGYLNTVRLGKLHINGEMVYVFPASLLPDVDFISAAQHYRTKNSLMLTNINPLPRPLQSNEIHTVVQFDKRLGITHLRRTLHYPSEHPTIATIFGRTQPSRLRSSELFVLLYNINPANQVTSASLLHAVLTTSLCRHRNSSTRRPLYPPKKIIELPIHTWH